VIHNPQAAIKKLRQKRRAFRRRGAHNTERQSFSTKDARDARFRELKARGAKGLVRYTEQEFDRIEWYVAWSVR
jgi:hypothetical protein